MKKNLLFLNFLLSQLLFGQIGVNTENPFATLDIAGKPTDITASDGVLAPRLTGDQLMAKDAVYGINQDGAIVYVTAAVGTNTPKTVNVTAPGYYYYDAPNAIWKTMIGGDSNSSGTVLYASRDGAWSLLDLGISGTNWNKIGLTSSDVKTGSASLFNVGVYTAPKTGFYEVKYEVQLEGGVDLSVLGGKKLGVLKNGTTIIEDKVLDAVRVSILNITVAAVPVTSTTLNTLVQLNAGETLTFAVETGGVNLGLLTDGKVSVSVFKVTN